MHAASAFGLYVLYTSTTNTIIMDAEGNNIGSSGNGGGSLFMGFCCLVSAVLAGVGLVCVVMGLTGVKRDVAEKVGMVEE